jgi:hypothetical protein
MTTPTDALLNRSPVRQSSTWSGRRFIEGLRRRRRHLLFRSLMAAPFVVAFLLTLALGPATVDSKYISSGWLALLSLVVLVLMVAAPDWLLIPLGLVTFLIFPALAGLGFYFAPAWAVPLAAVVFYGSALASAAATVTGLVKSYRRLFRGRRRVAIAKAIGAAALLLPFGFATSPGSVSASSESIGQSATSMGPIINTSAREAEPSFTSDGQTMYFNCQTDQICVTHLLGTWEEGRWMQPELVGAPITTPYTEVEPMISPEGNKLYITSNRPFPSGEGLPGLSLYVDAFFLIETSVTDRFGVSLLGGLGHNKVMVSQLQGGVWSPPQNLDAVVGEPPIDGTFNDHCLFVSPDGTEAFWSSDRPGGYGDNDIWTMRKVDGVWTKPQNMGSNINGPYSDHHSMLGPDGKSLYVTSERPGGHGGEDIYVSTREADGSWSPLMDLTAPVNGPGNDRCPVLSPDGRIWLFDSDRAGGYGSKDIWWVYAWQVSSG